MADGIPQDAPYLALLRAGVCIVAVPYFDFDKANPHTNCQPAYGIWSFNVQHAHRRMDGHRRLSLEDINEEFCKANQRNLKNVEEAVLFCYVAGDMALPWYKGRAPDSKVIAYLESYYKRLDTAWRRRARPLEGPVPSRSSSCDEQEEAEDGADDDDAEEEALGFGRPPYASVISQDDVRRMALGKQVAVVSDIDLEDLSTDF